MSRSRIIIIGLIITVGYFGYIGITRFGKFPVSVKVSPTQARVFIDDKELKSNLIYLKPGGHTFKASFSGFATSTQKINIDKEKDVILSLDPISDEGRKYLEEHPGEQLYREAAGAADAQQATQETAKHSRLVNLLPFDGVVYLVDYETKKVNGKYQFQVGITADTPADRQSALKWIRSQGVDPSTVKIIFRDTGNPFVTDGGQE